jgi:hypothetical protein
MRRKFSIAAFPEATRKLRLRSPTGFGFDIVKRSLAVVEISCDVPANHIAASIYKDSR